MAFQKTYDVLMEVDRNSECINDQTLATIINAFATHLEDSHIKVSLFIVKCMPDIIQHYPHLCAKHSSIILRRCLKGLAECKGNSNDKE
jgi:hypothetical protein